MLISFCETFGVKYRIIRISSIYGKDKTQSNTKNVLGHMVNLLKDDMEISLYDGGEYYRDYMHVEDVSRAIKSVIEYGELNSIYNIGTGEPRLYKDVIFLAKKILNSNSNIVSVETPDFYKKVQYGNFTLNVDKLKLLGFQISIPLEDGLNDLCCSKFYDII